MTAVGATLVNVVIVIVLAVYMVRRKTAYSVAMSILIYANLHHAYLALFMLLEQDFIRMHQSPPSGPTVVGVALLIFVFIWVLCLYRYDLVRASQSRLVRWYVFLTVGWCAVALLEWAWDGVGTNGVPGRLAIKESLASLFLLVMALPLGIGLARNGSGSRQGWQIPVYAILLIQVVSVAVGLYEVLAHTAWAGYLRGDGVVVYRAGGLSFNPNVLGFWSAFFVLAGCYLYQRRVLASAYAFGFLVFGAAGLFLSGSRSNFLLTMIILTVILFLAMFKKKTSRVGIPLIVFFAAFASFLLLGKLMSVVVGDSALSLVALADRFIDLPIAITIYVASYTGYSEIAALLLEIFPSFAFEARNVMISIEGRFGTELADNAYIAMRGNTGSISVVIWISIWVLTLWCGLVAIAKRGTLETIYSVVLIGGGLVTGLFMRAYQVVPISLVITVSLGLALSVLLRSEIDGCSST